MSLVSYIRNSLRFGIMLPLVPAVKILKKNWGHGENLGEAGVKLLRDLTNVSILVLWQLSTSGFC